MSTYAAAIRVAQALVLFLTAVSYMFSPFVADLYERGLRDRLNALFKQITRWTLGGTIPLLLLFMIAPAAVLHLFGGSYDAGSAWLRVLADRADRERERGRRRVHPDHGGSHGMGSAGVRPVVPAGPRGRDHARAASGPHGRGDRAGQRAGRVQRAAPVAGVALRADPALRPLLRAAADPHRDRRRGDAGRACPHGRTALGRRPGGDRADRRRRLLRGAGAVRAHARGAGEHPADRERRGAERKRRPSGRARIDLRRGRRRAAR